MNQDLADKSLYIAGQSQGYHEKIFPNLKPLPDSKNFYSGDSKEGSISLTGRPGPIGQFQSNLINTRGLRCTDREHQSNGGGGL